MALLGSEQSINIVIEAKDRASRVFNDLESKVQKTSRTFTNVGKKMTAGLTLPIAALGVASVKAAADFEASMGDLATLVGAGTTELGEMEEGIKDLLKVIPKSAEDLGASAYSILSAGITDTSEALSVLEQSGKLAVAGLATTEQATDLLTTAINAFGKSGKDAENVANVLFKTVKAGKTTVADMTQSFGKMAGNASAASISFEDVQAATAALTTVTGKTSESQNALAQVFLELTVAGGKLDKGLEEAGSSLADLNATITEEGLVDGMESLRDQLGLTDTEFKNLFSSAEGGTAVFQLLTSANKAAKDTYTQLTNSTDALTEAFDAQSATFSAAFQIIKNNLNLALLELGNSILPALTDIINNNIIPAIQALTEWWKALSPETQKFILIAALLVATVGPLLIVIGGIISLLPALAAGFAILVGPVGLVIGIVSGLTATIGVLNEIVKLLQEDWDLVWEGIKITIKEVIDWIIENPIKALTSALSSILSMISQVMGFGGAFNVAKKLGSAIGGALGFEHGGLVPGAIGQPVPIMAHGGERVIPASRSGSGSGSGMVVVHINNPVIRDRSDITVIRSQIELAMRDVVRNNKLQTA